MLNYEKLRKILVRHDLMNSQKLRSAGKTTKKRILENLNFSFYNRKFTFELVFYGKYITVYILFAVNILQFGVVFKS